ncbi:MAG: Gfo/Idh/MocA family protein [Kiritimatiellia bacterium]|jgi:UDP-N-acetyl-2-amino-2-deoxyglucuronate dehydrogenase
MKKLRVAVIGCGVIGPLHLECFKQLDFVEIAWTCDLIPERAKNAAEKFGAGKWAVSAEEVFADPTVQAVSICTDHASHADLAIAALEAGKDVLCEKALAQNRQNLDRMLEAAERHPERVFGGVFQHRFDPINRELRAMLSEGVFGTLLTAGMQLRCFRSNAYYKADAWRGTWKREGGSVLINQAIHYIDQLLWLTGGAKSVIAMIDNFTHRDVIETEDTAAAVLRLSCGALGTIEATASSHIEWESNLSFHGDQGAIDIRNDKPFKIDFRDKTIEASVKARLDEAIAPKPAAVGKAYYGTGHQAQITDFAESVRDRRPPFVTVASAADTLSTVFDIYDAARLHKQT